MVVPRSRLLLWAAIVLLPFGTLAGMETGARPFALIAIAALVVCAAADAALTPCKLAGITLKVPEVLRASRGRELNLPIRIRNEGQQARAVRLTLNLPESLMAESDTLSVTLPEGSEFSEAVWRLVPSERGKFSITEGRVEAVSPLGFWAVWKSIPIAGEVRVYPNLLTERRSLAALFLNRGAVGLHAQRLVGKGRDFEKLREYVPGDSFDEIHWKATAKRGQPITKVFQIERTQEIYVVIDSSRLSARKVSGDDAQGTADTTLERFLTAALVVALAAEQQGDLFGLLTFSDKIDTFVRARNGTSHFHACRDALYALQPREVTPDFDEVSAFLRLRLRRRALLLFLTSLDDPVTAESFVRNMDLVCRQHLIMVNMLQQPGVAPLFSQRAESDQELYAGLAGHIRWQSLRELERVLKRRGVQFATLPSERLAVDLVSQYLNVKQRQLL